VICVSVMEDLYSCVMTCSYYFGLHGMVVNLVCEILICNEKTILVMLMQLMINVLSIWSIC
jgi:hypothetical protein